MVNRILPLHLSDASVKKSGRMILEPTNWVLTPAGCTIVMGPNGAGKTTLLRLMHGLEKPTEGAVKWQTSFKDACDRQSFIFQAPVVMRRSVLENLIFPLLVRGGDRPNAVAKASEWLTAVGLTNFEQKPAGILSGGEKQKLAMARALIIKPEVLFLDEPTTNLDGASTQAIENLIKKAILNGTRIVMATHDMGQARRLATEVLFLLHGKIHEFTDATTFFDAPKTAEAKSFLQGDILV